MASLGTRAGRSTPITIDGAERARDRARTRDAGRAPGRSSFLGRDAAGARVRGVSAGTTFASDTSAASTRGRVLHRRARGDSMTKRVDAGTPIGEWVLEEKLGQGTFGEV